MLGIRAHPEAGKASGVDEVFGPAALVEALGRADFVCLLSTLTEQARGIIAAAELAAVKRTAYLINAARGALVEYAALLAALRGGQIAGAAFDTFWTELADPADPILQESTFFLSPHVAGFSDVSIDFVTDVVAENVRRLLDGRELLNEVLP